MKPDDLLPLQEPTFYILLSLAEGEKHGYAILKDVAELSGGRLQLGTGTLYGALSRLLEQRLIQRAANGAHPPEGGPDELSGRAVKAYALTHGGRQVLQAETGRLECLLAAARLRLGQEGA